MVVIIMCWALYYGFFIDIVSVFPIILQSNCTTLQFKKEIQNMTHGHR